MMGPAKPDQGEAFLNTLTGTCIVIAALTIALFVGAFIANTWPYCLFLIPLVGLGYVVGRQI